jgi:hypothetical protein
MRDLFFMGGPLFMSILSLLLIVVLAWMIYHFVNGLNKSAGNRDNILLMLTYGRSIGLFALITGILGQMIGLYMAFFAIERAADISPILVLGGIKVSMISTIYGMVIYLLSILLWFVFSYFLRRGK